MNAELITFLDGVAVGVVEQSGGGALTFTYDESYRSRRDATPLSLAMPPYPDHHINEFMTMAAARELGLHVANDSLETTELGDVVFIAERYDRRLEGDRWHRLHQEDLCQALSVPPEKKYQADGGPGVAEIARLFRGLPDAEDRSLSAERFYDALVFSVATLGTDAHAKNYSLLLRGDRATLAPLYDLGSHAPYPMPKGVHPTLAMSIEGEKLASRIGIGVLTAAGVRFGVERERVEARAREITDGVVQAYRVAADAARTQLGEHPFIERMVEAIEEYSRSRQWNR